MDDLQEFDLPGEVLDAIEQPERERLEQLEAISGVLAAKRAEAVKARRESGIETVWLECEEAYLGIDDANRHEFAGANWIKPLSGDGPLTAKNKTNNGGKSTAFVRLSSRYVDAGAAKLTEILLPIDDKAFAFGPMPVPDLIEQLKDVSPAADAAGQPVMAQGPQGPQPVAVRDIAQQIIDAAAIMARKAEDRIYGWMINARHPMHMRKVIHDAARLGAGVLKAPFPAATTSKAVVRKNGVAEVVAQEMIVPDEKRISLWNLFPAPDCGEDIHSGDHLFERDFISRRTLRELKRVPGYITKHIDQVLKEGVRESSREGANPNDKRNKNKFEIWYYYGTMSRDELEAADAIGAKDLPADQDDVYVIATMVNDTIIRVSLNPLDSGEFPYHVIPWSRRDGHWAGVGVTEQCRVAQRMVNSATRAMLNNAGKSAGAQIILDRGAIVPADGNWTITPDKIWFKTADSGMADVRQAFFSVEFPNQTPQLMSIIEYGFRLAEESTNIPLVTQGQSGKTTPDTFGAVALQDNNANQLLRSIASTFDDCITEPLIQQYYEWLLLDPNVPDEEKGDFKINARGSAALVERSIQDQFLISMVGMANDPEFALDKRKMIVEILKSRRIEATRLQLSEADQAKRAQQPVPPPPEIQVAQIQAKAKTDSAQIAAEGMLQAKREQDNSHHVQSAALLADAKLQESQIRSETQLNVAQARVEGEMAYAGMMRQVALDNQNARAKERHDMMQLEILKYANENRMSLEQVKADLAKQAMIEQTKREVAAAQTQMLDNEKAGGEA